jgi:cobalt-precorrin-5B (C1)-methyltransferase
MGDFVGGMLKYLRTHPVPRLTIAGGFAKLAKLAAGHLDLHSGRSRVDTAALGDMLAALGANGPILERTRAAGGAGEVLGAADAWREPLARLVAARAREVALATLSGKTAVEVAIVDRDGGFLARVGGW